MWAFRFLDKDFSGILLSWSWSSSNSSPCFLRRHFLSLWRCWGRHVRQVCVLQPLISMLVGFPFYLVVNWNVTEMGFCFLALESFFFFSGFTFERKIFECLLLSILKLPRKHLFFSNYPMSPKMLVGSSFTTFMLTGTVGNKHPY